MSIYKRYTWIGVFFWISSLLKHLLVLLVFGEEIQRYTKQGGERNQRTGGGERNQRSLNYIHPWLILMSWRHPRCFLGQLRTFFAADNLRITNLFLALLISSACWNRPSFRKRSAVHLQISFTTLFSSCRYIYLLSNEKFGMLTLIIPFSDKHCHEDICLVLILTLPTDSRWRGRRSIDGTKIPTSSSRKKMKIHFPTQSGEAKQTLGVWMVLDRPGLNGSRWTLHGGLVQPKIGT